MFYKFTIKSKIMSDSNRELESEVEYEYELELECERDDGIDTLGLVHLLRLVMTNIILGKRPIIFVRDGQGVIASTYVSSHLPNFEIRLQNASRNWYTI